MNKPFENILRFFIIKCARCKRKTVRSKTLNEMKQEGYKHYCIECDQEYLKDKIKRCKFYEERRQKRK